MFLNRLKKIVSCALAVSTCAAVIRTNITNVQAEGETSSDCKVHFLTLTENTNSIVLECNGKFGMVDSGEDSDYPDGTDPRYPFRVGIYTGKGFEYRVIEYLNDLGVNADNFEFYIGTHAHSDHIGSADEVIRTFHPKRVYIEPYSDSDITKTSALWDNLYVYDTMIKAAKDVNATLIQGFNTEAPLYPERNNLTGTLTLEKGQSLLDEVLTLTYTDKDGNEVLEPVTVTGEEIAEQNGVTLPEKPEVTPVPTTSPEPTESPEPTPSAEPAESPEPSASAEPTAYPTPSAEPTASPEPTPSAEPEDVTYTFTVDHLQKYDDDKNELEYTVTAAIGEISDITTSEDTSGSLYEATTDHMDTTRIASRDRIDEDNEAELYNIIPDNQAGARNGKYENFEGGVSTPVFMLGGENGMKISILNYGSERPVPDANYNSLAVLVTDMTSGHTAYIAGDVNNYRGTETKIAQTIGHVDLMVLGHHGVYGSNTHTYLTTLSPEIAVLCGNYHYVTDTTDKGDWDVLDSLIELGNNGTKLLTTAWYAEEVKALVVDLKTLQDNMPEGEHFGVTSPGASVPLVAYKDGYPETLNGFYDFENETYYFENSCFASADTWIEKNGLKYYAGKRGALLKEEWLEFDGNYYYFKKTGAMATGWLYLNDTYYLSKKDGAMVTGWQTIGGREYYFNETGALSTGWVQKDGKYVYLDKDNRIVTGIQKIDGYTYAFDDEGYLRDGWVEDGNDRYYFRSDNNRAQTGWMEQNGDTFYFQADGKMSVGRVVIDNVAYFFDENGHMTSGWKKIDGVWHFIDDAGVGAKGWMKIHDNWYYFDNNGAMKTGWILDNKNWYYLDDDGTMVTGHKNIGGTDYAFLDSGKMVTGWGFTDGYWYYGENNGALRKGWSKIGNTWYYFKADGAMATGWVKDGGSWYYMNSNGTMKTGWLFDGTSWYFLYGSGAMATGWVKVGNNWYYMYTSGAMATGWVCSGGSRYYMYSSGAMATGWIQDGENWYYMYGSGAMSHDTWIGNYYMESDGAMAVNALVDHEKYVVDENGVWALTVVENQTSEIDNTTTLVVKNDTGRTLSVSSVMKVYDAEDTVLGSDKQIIQRLASKEVGTLKFHVVSSGTVNHYSYTFSLANAW